MHRSWVVRWNAHLVASAALAFVVAVCGGCVRGKLASSLGALPVAQAADRSRAEWDAEPNTDVLDPALRLSTEGNIPLLKIRYVDWTFEPVPENSVIDRVYKVVDVSYLERRFDLGVPDTEPNADRERRARRGMIANYLLSVADDNGNEYWRRFVANMTYYEAGKAASTALMGAGIASTFISPVIGASIAGAGLFIDTGVTYLTDNFDPELYSTLREAAHTKREIEKKKIRTKLVEMPYAEYPVSEVIADVNRYAYWYTIRGVVDGAKETDRQLAALLSNRTSSWQKVSDEYDQLVRRRRPGVARADAEHAAAQVMAEKLRADHAPAAPVTDPELAQHVNKWHNELKELVEKANVASTKATKAAGAADMAAAAEEAMDYAERAGVLADRIGAAGAIADARAKLAGAMADVGRAKASADKFTSAALKEQATLSADSLGKKTASLSAELLAADSTSTLYVALPTATTLADVAHALGPKIAGSEAAQIDKVLAAIEKLAKDNPTVAEFGEALRLASGRTRGAVERDGANAASAQLAGLVPYFKAADKAVAKAAGDKLKPAAQVMVEIFKQEKPDGLAALETRADNL